MFETLMNYRYGAHAIDWIGLAVVIVVIACLKIKFTIVIMSVISAVIAALIGRDTNTINWIVLYAPVIFVIIYTIFVFQAKKMDPFDDMVAAMNRERAAIGRGDHKTAEKERQRCEKIASQITTSIGGAVQRAERIQELLREQERIGQLKIDALNKTVDDIKVPKVRK